MPPFSETVIREFFSLVAGIYAEHEDVINPQSIYNLDETGLNTDYTSKRVFVPPEYRDAYHTQATCGKAIYSVLFCTSATGRYLYGAFSVSILCCILCDTPSAPSTI